jgi:hypothetical protein
MLARDKLKEAGFFSTARSKSNLSLQLMRPICCRYLPENYPQEFGLRSWLGLKTAAKGKIRITL